MIATPLDALSQRRFAFSASERAATIDRVFGGEELRLPEEIDQLELLGVTRSDLKLLGDVLEKRAADLMNDDELVPEARGFDSLARAVTAEPNQFAARLAIDRAFVAGDLGAGPNAIRRHKWLAARIGDLAMADPTTFPDNV